MQFMQMTGPSPDRRGFLGLVLGVPAMAMLGGCGGGSDTNAAVTAMSANSNALGSHPLNLALNLAYLGAQYYGYAARGTGLSARLTSGIGKSGEARGARQAWFGDQTIAGHAAELADDKQAHVVALRGQIGALAAAQPQIDLSVGATSAFAVAGQTAGIAAAGNGFDPYAGDQAFLLGAFMIENVVAAAYRTLLVQGGDAGDQATLQAQLGDAIYHGGLIRSLLDNQASTDPSVDKALVGVSAMLAALDGTNIGDQTLAGASGASSNLFDADSRPIPFTRSTGQVLNALYLSSSGIGGFLPAGVNGVAA